MTDDEIRAHLDASETALKATTVSYPTWLKNYQAGKYTHGSQWETAFNELRAIRDSLSTVPVPPLPPTSIIPATAKLIWSSSFETGDFSDWAHGPGDIQQIALGRAKVISGPAAAGKGGPESARVGKFYYEAEVHNGDNVSGGERCEICKFNDSLVHTGQQGAEQWWQWSFWIPTTYPISIMTGLVGGQIHSDYNYAQSNEFFVSPSTAGLPIGTSAEPHYVYGVSGGPAVANGQYLDKPFSKAFDVGPLSWYQGKWIDNTLHVIWRNDTTPSGTVELWMKDATSTNWVKRVDRVGNVANCFQGYNAYFKAGMNRIQNSGLGIGYCWYDDFRLYTP